MERILDFQRLEQEPLYKGELTELPSQWPLHGQLQYRNVSLKYDEKSDRKALDKIDLSIESTEKIGIVGRTGAGKTSFLQTLFRLYEPQGLILIDGIDVKKLRLVDLRNALTIISV